MPSQMWAGPRRTWRYTLDLNALVPIMESLPDGPNDEVPEGTQQRIVEAITSACERAGLPITEEVTDLLDSIRYSDEMWELRQEWESFYDYCDDQRIWVDTHGIREE